MQPELHLPNQLSKKKSIANESTRFLVFLPIYIPLDVLKGGDLLNFSCDILLPFSGATFIHPPDEVAPNGIQSLGVGKGGGKAPPLLFSGEGEGKL